MQRRGCNVFALARGGGFWERQRPCNFFQLPVKRLRPKGGVGVNLACERARRVDMETHTLPRADMNTTRRGVQVGACLLARGLHVHPHVHALKRVFLGAARKYNRRARSLGVH